MAVTRADLQQRLKERYSPDDIVELLDLDSEELVDMFGDRVDEKFDYLLKELEMEEDESEDQS